MKKLYLLIFLLLNFVLQWNEKGIYVETGMCAYAFWGDESGGGDDDNWYDNWYDDYDWNASDYYLIDLNGDGDIDGYAYQDDYGNIHYSSFEIDEITVYPDPDPNPEPEPEPDPGCDDPCACWGDCGDEGLPIGDDGDSIGKPYVAKQGDVLFRPDFIQTMERQVKNSCVTSILEYVSKLFGEHIGEGKFYLSYYYMTGNIVAKSGVDISLVEQLTKIYFNTVENQNVITILNNGGVIMTNIPSSIDGSGHNVLIVGYNSSEGVLIYMDPEVGDLQIAHPNDFMWNYILGITGIKDDHP